MKNSFYRHLALAALSAVALKTAAAPPTDPANGQLYRDGDNTLAWSEPRDQWVGIVDFWLEYAPTASGKFWGRSPEYPPYQEVGEHDTLLVELDQGPCLMYFFHNRWRRAQDVRRWDPGFNALLGCPHVFD